MSLPDGYDAWLTSGDPHAGQAVMQCPNQGCELYAHSQFVPAHVEYGRAFVTGDEECIACGGELVSERDVLPELDEERNAA